MKCYRCRKEVTDMTHGSIKTMMDNLSEEEQSFVAEHLDLIHCVAYISTPKDVFDELGHTVICMDCYTEAIQKYILEGRKFFSVAHDEEIGTLQDVIDTLIGNFDDEMYAHGFIYEESVYKSTEALFFHAIGQLMHAEYSPEFTLAELEYIFTKVWEWQKDQ